MVEPQNALPGRPNKMMVPDRHYVLGNKMEGVPAGHKEVVFANGCFWGSEKGIWRLPGDGIYNTGARGLGTQPYARHAVCIPSHAVPSLAPMPSSAN